MDLSSESLSTDTKYNFDIEEIGDDQKLFYRVHIVNIDENETDEIKKIKPIAFDPKPKGSEEMSVNWEKYITAEETKKEARSPEKTGILSFISGVLRANPINLNVTHDPHPTRSHSIVHNIVSRQNDAEIRIKLRNVCKWEIAI